MSDKRQSKRYQFLAASGSAQIGWGGALCPDNVYALNHAALRILLNGGPQEVLCLECVQYQGELLMCSCTERCSSET